MTSLGNQGVQKIRKDNKIIWSEGLDSGGQQFHQYIFKKEQSSPTLTHWTHKIRGTVTKDVGNPCLGLDQVIITAYPCAATSRFLQPDKDDGWISSWIHSSYFNDPFKGQTNI